jgi:hypothetical protein
MVHYRVCGEGEDTDGIVSHHKLIESAQRLGSRLKGVIDTVARFSVTEQIARV